MLNKNMQSSAYFLRLEEIKEQIYAILEKLNTTQSSQNSSLELGAINSNLSAITTSLSLMQNNIISETAEENTTLEDRLNTTLASIYQMCQIINTSISSLPTSSSSSTNYDVTLASMQSTLNSILSNLTIALNNLSASSGATGTPVSGVSPFNPNPEQVYVTNAIKKLDRQYSSSLTSIKTYREFFVIDSQSPSLLKIDYDLTLNENLSNVILNVYIDEQIVKSFYLDSALTVSGTTHFMHYCLFQLNRTNASIYLEFVTTGSASKTIKNIMYEIEGNNAVFLREGPSEMYYIWPCGNYYYLARKNSSEIAYITLERQNLNFNQPYTTVTSMSETYGYIPIFYGVCKPSNSETTANGVSFYRFEYSSGRIYFYRPDTGVVRTSVNAIINSQYCEYASASAVMVASTQSTMLTVLQTQEKGILSYKFGAAATSSGNFGPFIFDLSPINFMFAKTAFTSIGVADTALYYIMQNNTGNWTFAQFNNASAPPALNIGFGTRADFGFVPHLISDQTRTSCYRVFMFVYDHWVAKYICLNGSNAPTIALAVTIAGDYDQILSGEGNEYFTVKNGTVVKCIDTNIAQN